MLVAFIWELTKETIYLPLSCLQGGKQLPAHAQPEADLQLQGYLAHKKQPPPRTTIGP